MKADQLNRFWNGFVSAVLTRSCLPGNIIFFITSVRNAAEPRNLVTSLNLMDNKILNMKMTNF